MFALKKIFKYFLSTTLGVILVGSSVYALQVLTVPQGGTGAATLTGCLTGNGTGAITGTGSACGSGGGGTFPFTPTTNFSTIVNATATPIWFQAGLMASSTLYISSSTGPQAYLSDTINNPWTFRSAGGFLYLATSSASGLATSTTPAITVTSNGFVGLGTSSPMAQLSGTGNVAFYGGNYHFGTAPLLFACPGNTCLDITGSDNTTGGVQAFIQNRNSGTAAFTGLNLENDIGTSNLINFAGLFFNSTNYTDTTFGTGVNGKSQLTLQNTIGRLSLVVSTTTSQTEGFINALVGGAASTNEIWRTTIQGLGIGTTTPAFLLQLASSTAPQLALSDGSNSSNHWTFRSAGGELYIASSSPTTFATSTLAQLTINAKGQVLIGDGSATFPDLAFVDDTNNGIFSPSNDVFAWATNGTERFRTSDGSGFSGFGTTTPNWLLQLATTTGPQLALSDGVSHYTLRNQAGTFYLATSSPTTFATSSISALVVDTSGNVGIGVNKPSSFDKLAVHGGVAVLDSSRLRFYTADNSNHVYFQNSGTITSNANMGLYISGASPDFFVSSVGFVGIATTTPAWNLDVAKATAPQLALSDTTLTSNHWTFRNAGGLLYIATASPSTFATSSASAFSLNASGIPAFPALGGATGCAQFSTAGLLSNTGTACGTGGGGGGGAGQTSTSSAPFTYNIYPNGTANTTFSVGTSTPAISQLTVSSSTAPQLTLADGSLTDSQWFMRNNGGNFFFGTSSASTFATSSGSVLSVTNAGTLTVGSTTVLSVDLNTSTTTVGNLTAGRLVFAADAGVVSLIDLPVVNASANTVESYVLQIAGSTTAGVYGKSNGSGSITNTGSFFVGATTTPWTTFSLVGTGAMQGLTASAGLQTGIVCLSANSELINESVACVASAERFKTNIKNLNVGLDEVMKLRPVSFLWKPEYNGNLKNDPNKSGVQYSLIADEVQKVDPRLVSVEVGTTTFEGKTYSPGTVQGLQDPNHWIALFVKAFQDLVARLVGIEDRLDSQQKQIDNLQARINNLHGK